MVKIPKIQSAHDSETRNIINALIERFNSMGYTYDQAMAIAQDILDEARQVNTENTDTNGRLDNIIADSGTSSTEVVDARLDADGVSHAVLKERLDKNEVEMSDRLTNNEEALISSYNRRFINPISNHKKRKPFITILDDDTRNELYTKLYPVMRDRGLPFTSAAIPGRIGTSELTITPEQYDEMLESGVVEFISHTYTHQNLTTLTPEQVENELIQSRDWIYKNGGNPDHFVPPFGANGINDTVNEFIKKYYKSSFVTSQTGHAVTPPLDSYYIRRSDFEATVAEQKARIDAVKNADAWLIINTHAAYSSFDATNLNEVIDYALAQGLEFVTVGEGMSYFGNLLETQNGGIDADGSMFGELQGGALVKTDNTGFTADTPLRDFEPGQITVHVLKNIEAQNAGFPMVEGTVETYRHYDDAYALSYQRVYPADGSSVSLRRWSVSQSKWMDWTTILAGKIKRESLSLGSVSVGANTNVSQIVTPTKMSLSTSRAYSITPTSNPQGIVYTWSVNSSGGIVFRFNNLTSDPITFDFSFNISEVISET